MISKTTCTGCGACTKICKNNAIEMRENAIGELSPVVNKHKCSNCNLCVIKCPQNQNIAFVHPNECYVAWSKDENDLKFSASGGIASVFAKYVFSTGGIPFGCDYDSNCNLQHFPAHKCDDLFKFQSSKYSQSNAFVCYDEIENNLKKGNFVLFVGTPCQISGLKSFLAKDYQKLVTVDLICHGTPPNRYLKEHILNICENKKISKIRFRGEFDQHLCVWSNNKLIYRKDKYDDIYFKSFYQNIISRNSCYECKYAQPIRVSDITIGDFWGLGKLSVIEKKSNRPSIVLINTSKGSEFFQSVICELLFEERPVDEGIIGNGRLNNPPGKSLYASLFQFLYKILKFEKAAKLTLFIKYHLSELMIKLRGKI